MPASSDASLSNLTIVGYRPYERAGVGNAHDTITECTARPTLLCHLHGQRQHALQVYNLDDDVSQPCLSSPSSCTCCLALPRKSSMHLTCAGRG